MIDWIIPAGSPPIRQATIQLWRIDLERDPSQVQAMRRLLSADEITRAERFHFERDRRRYIVARGALRTILGGVLKRPGADVEFRYGDHEKPYLADSHPLRFNLSHSNEMGMVGLWQDGEIGVDVEWKRELNDLDSLAEHVYTPDECRRLFSYHGAERVDAFYAAWTRKEAYLKGIGKGLALPLQSFSVSSHPDLHQPPLSAPGWQLYAFRPAIGYQGAVAVQKDAALEFWQWEPQ